MKRITKIGVNETRYRRKRLRLPPTAVCLRQVMSRLLAFEAQKAHYEEYIRANDEWEYVGLYYDEGITGTKKDGRAGLLFHD